MASYSEALRLLAINRVAVEKLFWSVIRVKSGHQKCLEIRADGL